MTFRKLALQVIVLLLLLFSFTTEYFAQSQQAYRYLGDFSYLTKDRRTEDEKAEDFIQALKRGDQRVFKMVEYNVVLRVANILTDEAFKVMKKESPYDKGILKAFMWQMGGENDVNRRSLIDATIPGIFNLDPRVRLVATSWLRVLRPDPRMMRAVKMAVGVDVRVIRYDHASDDFVFTHPRIYETVASWEEYYREKDIDLPSVFAPGHIETNLETSENGENFRVGGMGTNSHLANPYNRDAEGYTSDAKESQLIVTGLDARRWGSPNTYDATRRWEATLPYWSVDAKTSQENCDESMDNCYSTNPVSLQDYYERINSALKIAWDGLQPGMKLPNGQNFSEKLYDINGEPCKERPTRKEQSDLCPDYWDDLAFYSAESIKGKWPGTKVRPAPFAGERDSFVTGGKLDGKDYSGLSNLEADQSLRNTYRYYPDLSDESQTGGLSELNPEIRKKMELLLGQNWQMGKRVPIGSGRIYVFVDGYGTLTAGNPWVELTKLDMFITRFVWYEKAKSGYKNALTFVSKDTFATMYLSIDGESPDMIPFLSCAGPNPMFNYKDVPVLLEGLRKNKVVSNRYVIMRALKDVYEQKPPYAELCPPEVQRDINIALWETKRENSRVDIDTGKIMHREAITVGKAPARPYYIPPTATANGDSDAYASDLDPVGPVDLEKQARRDRTFDLGFARPNDEVLANSHRVIVTDFDYTDQNNALDLNLVYSLDRLFKQRFYNLVGPDNGIRDYYRHRVEYSRLWNDPNMPVMVTDAPAGYSDSQKWPPIADADVKGVNESTLNKHRALEPAKDAVGKMFYDASASDARIQADGTVNTDSTMTWWEAARYLDSLIVYNIDRMERANSLMKDILNGNRQAFMEAEWKDVESMIILCLKRLETIHTFYSKDCDNPLKVGQAGGPDKCPDYPNYTFFDMLQRVDVVRTYSDNDPELFVCVDPANNRVNLGLEACRRSKDHRVIQVRRKKEFVPIVQQVEGLRGNTFSEDKRDKIIQAALGGIFNKDPRIRLTAIHFLRRLGPDETMLADVEKARNITATPSTTVESAETDDFRSAFIDTYTYRRWGNSSPDLSDIADYLIIDRHKYEGAVKQDIESRAKDLTTYMSYLESLPPTAKYKELIPHPNYQPNVNEYHRVVRIPTQASGSANPRTVRFYGFYQLKAPSEELEKLYKYIHRKRLVRAIQGGDVNVIKKLSRSEFTILAESVDNEWVGYVPLQSFHAKLLTGGDWDKYGWGYRIPSDLAIFKGKDVRVIKEGINNPNFLVQKGTAEFLIRFYNFYDACTEFNTRAPRKPCDGAGGYEPNGSFKKEIRDSIWYYVQDDIVVQEFELAFNGENPDGRAVIRAGSDLSYHLNPGGERVYLSLPERIRRDIRDAVWGDYERLPEELKSILGIISTRAPRQNVLSYYNIKLGLEPSIPIGDAGDQLSEF